MSNETENTGYDRIDDVMVGIDMYSQMISLIYHISGQSPLITPLASSWMAQLIAKLVEWEVLSEQQHDQLMFRVRELTAERQAAEANNNIPELGDLEKDLIAQLGI